MARQMTMMSDARYTHRSPRYVIAAQLLETRQTLKLTQAEVAQLTGFSQAFIARCESGQANITIDTIGKLASVYGRYLRLAEQV